MDVYMSGSFLPSPSPSPSVPLSLHFSLADVTDFICGIMRTGAGTVTAVLDEDEMTLRCNDGRSYRIMDKVRVRVGVDMAVENREGVKLELV